MEKLRDLRFYEIFGDWDLGGCSLGFSANGNRIFCNLLNFFKKTFYYCYIFFPLFLSPFVEGLAT